MLRMGRWPKIIVLLGVLLSRPLPAFAQHLGALTRPDIESAIAWGESGEPTPLLLHHDPGPENTTVVGAIYTPYVRVPLAARAAWQAGARLDPAAIPPAWTEPIAWVALRWYCCDPDRPDLATFNPLVPFDYKVAVPGDRALRQMPWIHPVGTPLWVRDDLSPLAPFGQLPYEDVALLVGYPLDVLRAGGDIVIFRHYPPERDGGHAGTALRVGRITPRDLAGWP